MFFNSLKTNWRIISLKWEIILNYVPQKVAVRLKLINISYSFLIFRKLEEMKI